MKFFSKSKDGGIESTVTAYWIIELKWLFSIAILRFDNGSRDAYHTHAFNCCSWLIRGELEEQFKESYVSEIYEPSIWPILTWRNTYHKVTSRGTSWVLTFRGPWNNTWKEFRPKEARQVELTHGRKELN